MNFTVTTGEHTNTGDAARALGIPIQTTLTARVECKRCHHVRKLACNVRTSGSPMGERDCASVLLWQGIRHDMESHRSECCNDAPKRMYFDPVQPIMFDDKLRDLAMNDVILHSMFSLLRGGLDVGTAVNAVLEAYSIQNKELMAKLRAMLERYPAPASFLVPVEPMPEPASTAAKIGREFAQMKLDTFEKIVRGIAVNECVRETADEEAQAAGRDRAEDPDGDRRPEPRVPDGLQERPTPDES